MVVYARQGDRTAALHQYERCREVMQSEFGQDPEDATIELYDRIRRDGTSRMSDARNRPGRAAVAPLPRHNLPAPVSSFVGRERVLAEIAGLLAEPSNRVISIVGPPGSARQLRL
jgi:hypothetical protein